MGGTISGKTKLYGILGNPVAHSFSPLIHNTLAEAMGIDMVYVPLGVADPSRIGDAVRGAAAMGIGGMNVTVPYKSAVIPFLSDIDPVAKAIGAVNTLVPIGADHSAGIITGYKGYNTDYLGLRRALQEMGLDLSSMDVVIIGAGGAARAAGFMCGIVGVQHLTILNRTVSKAQALAEEIALEFSINSKDIKDSRLLKGRASGMSAQSDFADTVNDHDPEAGKFHVRALPIEKAAESVRDGWNTKPILAIQCTNVGLAPKTEEVPIEDPEFYPAISAAYDCIYNPEETRFLSLVHEAGKPGRNGMDMLLWQGISAFTLWTGQEPERELAEEVRKKLNEFIRG